MARIHDIIVEQRALAVLLRREFKYSYRNIALKTKCQRQVFEELLSGLILKIQIPKT